MGLHGGKYTFTNPFTGATTTLEINDTSPSKLAAAYAQAAATLGITSAQMKIKCTHGHNPNRGNSNNNP